MVLIGNIIGCLLTAWLIGYAQPDCIEPAAKILAGRLAKRTSCLFPVGDRMRIHYDDGSGVCP